MKKTVSVIMLSLLLTNILMLTFNIQPVEAETIVVPDDYPTIQEAINNANEGDTVFVKNGTYYENVLMNKTVVLVGENPHTTVINGRNLTYVVKIAANGSVLDGFSIVNGSSVEGYSAISLPGVSNNLIRNNVISNNDAGIGLNSSSKGNIIVDNNITLNREVGLTLAGSNNTIIRNEITSNGETGIYILRAENNTIGGNTISFHISEGIFAMGAYGPCQGNIVANNTISFNEGGMYFKYTEHHNNIIANNTVESNSWGIALGGTDNTVTGNMFLSNEYFGLFIALYGSQNYATYNTFFHNGIGIELESTGNTIHHNDFINNTQQATMNSVGQNLWNDSYPYGGNYWSDLNPPDIYSGPYQNETGSDKIGDSPYIIDASNMDKYPLVYPVGYVPSPDLNGDGVIDIIDLVKIALAYGSAPGFPIWNPYVDLNQDSIIDIFDLVAIAVHFGETG